MGEAPYKTSDDVLNLETLPVECVVLGGGIVACELAQFLARVGCRVTQLQRSSQVLKEFSSDAGAVVGQSLRDSGIDLQTNTTFLSIDSLGGDRVRVNYERKDLPVQLRRTFFSMPWADLRPRNP